MAEKDVNKQIDNELEDLEVDNDEYERALAVLNSSKGARVRERNNRIKAEKKVKKKSRPGIPLPGALSRSVSRI